MSDAVGPFRELVRRVRTGDERAAEELVRDWEPALRRIVRVRLFDRRLRRVVAESDIVQAVLGSFFVRAALGDLELDTPDALARLLATMARNKIIDEARRAARRPGDVPSDASEPDAAIAAGPSPSRVVFLREVLDAARRQLAPDVQQLIAWREDGVTWDEIARRIGGTAEAARKRLTRAVDGVAVGLGLGSTW